MKNKIKEALAQEMIALLKTKEDVKSEDYSKIFSCAYRMVKIKKTE